MNRLNHWGRRELAGLLMACGLAMGSTLGGAPTARAAPIPTPSVIRFRVIANSDNPRDQALKLLVRDAVLRVLEPRLASVHSEQVAARRIRSLTGVLDQVANGVLKSYHAPYRARVQWTRTLFPTKAYGTWVLPAGQYQALLIELGRAEGHNWWCVLFPSLCFIDMGNALAVPEPAASVSTTLSPDSPAVARPTPVSPRHLRVSWRAPRFLTTFWAILCQ